jgi:hypothetical protein
MKNDKPVIFLVYHSIFLIFQFFDFSKKIKSSPPIFNEPTKSILTSFIHFPKNQTIFYRPCSCPCAQSHPQLISLLSLSASSTLSTRAGASSQRMVLYHLTGYIWIFYSVIQFLSTLIHHRTSKTIYFSLYFIDRYNTRLRR